MSKHAPGNHNNYSHFDSMSTKDLEEILRLDFQLPDDEVSDVDAIIYITEVIEKREKENPTGRFTDVHAAWASFKENYLPYVKEDKSLYDFEDLDMEEDIKQVPSEKTFRPRRKRRMSRAICITAVLIMILLTGTLIANAFGFNLWDIIAKWTKNTFTFSGSMPQETLLLDVPDSNNGDNFETIQQALDHYGVTEKLSPTWFPDDYLLEDIKVTETPAKIIFTAIYIRADEEILITIETLLSPFTRTYEKDSKDVIIFEINGVEHFIMTNLDIVNVVWKHKNYECSIIGNLSLEEAEKMINSIYERK